MVSFIEASEDSALLSLLKEDIQFYANRELADVTDGLNERQLAELQALAGEPDDKDIMSYDEFGTAANKWRTK